MYEEKTLQIYETNSYDDPEVYARKVFELCDMLANHYDTIRYKYWKYVLQKFKTKKEIARSAPVAGGENFNVQEQQILIDNQVWADRALLAYGVKIEMKLRLLSKNGVK